MVFLSFLLLLPLLLLPYVMSIECIGDPLVTESESTTTRISGLSYTTQFYDMKVVEGNGVFVLTHFSFYYTGGTTYDYVAFEKYDTTNSIVWRTLIHDFIPVQKTFLPLPITGQVAMITEHEYYLGLLQIDESNGDIISYMRSTNIRCGTSRL